MPTPPETSSSPTPQSELIDQQEWDVLLWLDGARYDYFKRLHPEYVDGDLEKAFNGGIGYTANWIAEHFPDSYDLQFFHGGQPIWSMLATNYDERGHFTEVIPHKKYNWSEEYGTCLPEETLRVFREHYDGGGAVVRFLAPHPPFPALAEVTRSKTRVRKVAQAIHAGDLDYDELQAAYSAYFRRALQAVEILVDELDEDVVITSDHGEYLGEGGNFFHGINYPGGPELHHVPWFRVGEP